MKGTEFEFDLQRETPADERIWRLNPYSPSTKFPIIKTRKLPRGRLTTWRYGLVG